MSVKKKDRHVSKSEPLEKSRILMHQLMILTRPAIDNDDGSRTKPGILGYGQPYYSFGQDIFNCGKQIHALCHQALQVYLKDDESLNTRTAYHRKAIEYCDSILRLLDLCIFEYGRNNKKKRNSFVYVAKLVRIQKNSIYDRMNRDQLIIQHQGERKRARCTQPLFRRESSL